MASCVVAFGQQAVNQLPTLPVIVARVVINGAIAPQNPGEATTLFIPQRVGMFRLSAYCEAPANGGGIGVTFGYNTDIVHSGQFLLCEGREANSVFGFRNKGGVPITYAVTAQGVPATYNLTIVLEQLDFDIASDPTLYFLSFFFARYADLPKTGPLIGFACVAGPVVWRRVRRKRLLKRRSISVT
jgi:hypothetical protein